MSNKTKTQTHHTKKKKSDVVIHMDDVKKNYYLGEMEVPVLHGIDLVIHRGEYVAIMGPSGSGKSTLMNLIGFLDRPTSGEYKLDGKSSTALSDNDLALIRNQKIGFVFQQFNLLPRTSALENVGLPLIYAGVHDKKERDRRAKEALQIVGLGDKLENKPNELSGGQQQRVSIARALINDPAILLADEPTGALDTKTTAELMELFDSIHKQGRTIIMITHEQDVADHAEKTIHIVDGLIAKQIHKKS